jgi:hypothetical protein
MHLHLKFFSDSSIFFYLLYGWILFLKIIKKIFLDNIYNVQYCMMFFFSHFILFDQFIRVFIFIIICLNKKIILINKFSKHNRMNVSSFNIKYFNLHLFFNSSSFIFRYC